MTRMRLRATVLMPVVVAVAMIMTSPLGAEVALAAEKGTVYGGMTSKGFPLMVEVTRDGRYIKRAVAAITSKCSDGGSYTVPSVWLHVPVRRNGSFKVTYRDQGAEGSFKESFVGRFNRARTKLTGRWRTQATFNNPDGTTAVCDSGSLKVRARQ